MNGRVAKKIRKQADELEVGGTSMWRKVYRQLKKEHKVTEVKNTMLAPKKRKRPANTAMATAKPKKKVKTT